MLLLVVGCCFLSFVVCCSMRLVVYGLFFGNCSLFVIRCVFLGVRCALFVDGCVLLAVCCHVGVGCCIAFVGVLFVVCCTMLFLVAIACCLLRVVCSFVVLFVAGCLF